MFRKIFWINLGLLIIVILLSYNLYKVWSQIMSQIKVPSVQITLDKKPDKIMKEEEKEDISDYRPSSRMSYSPVVEKDLFRPEREEWQPPPPPEEEEVELEQTVPYPQFPGQQSQPEIKEPTVHGIIIIGESKKYAIMQGWKREEAKERTRKIRLGNGQIREVPLPSVPGRLTQDNIKAYRIGDNISEAQVVDILPDKVVMEKEDGERYDVLLREPTRLEMWKPASQAGQLPGQGLEGEVQEQIPPQFPGGQQPYPGAPGIPMYPYVPVYPPVPPPGYIPPGFTPPQSGPIPPGARPQPPITYQPPTSQNYPASPGLQGRFPYPPVRPLTGQTKR